jgi:nucleoid-associated protein YgaU
VPGRFHAIGGERFQPREEDTMNLRDKYNHAIQVAKNLQMQGAAEEKEGKLQFRGTVDSEDAKNQIWNAIKTVPDWQRDVVGDIRVEAVAAAPKAAAATAPAQVTYTVQPGDTLSEIAKKHLGNANAYMDIFNANLDQLQDPDKVRPGQVLKIPAKG